MPPCRWITVMDARDELRRLIDVIEQGSSSVSVEQAVEDIKAFANTASFLANRLEGRLVKGDAAPEPKSKPRSRIARAIAQPPAVKSSQPRRPAQQQSGTGRVTSTAITQADFDRLKPIAPQSPISAG